MNKITLDEQVKKALDAAFGSGLVLDIAQHKKANKAGYVAIQLSNMMGVDITSKDLNEYFKAKGSSGYEGWYVNEVRARQIVAEDPTHLISKDLPRSRRADAPILAKACVHPKYSSRSQKALPE